MANKLRTDTQLVVKLSVYLTEGERPWKPYRVLQHEASESSHKTTWRLRSKKNCLQPNALSLCRVQGAQCMIFMQKLWFSSCPGAKLMCQGPLGEVTAQPCVLFFEIALSVECFVYPTDLRIRVVNWNRIFFNSIGIPFQPARVCWDGALDFNHSHSCNSSLSRTPLIPNTILSFFVGCFTQTQTERRYLPFSETTTRHLSCRKEHSVLCYSCNPLYRHNLRNKSPGFLQSNFSRKNHTDE